MDQFSKNKKSVSGVIITSILVVAAFLAVVFILIPALKKLKNNSERGAIANANIQNGTQYIKDVQAAYGRLQSNKEMVSLLNVAAPTDSDIAEALVQVDNIASSSGLALNALSPSLGENGEAKINVMVSGNYQDLEKFLQGIEKNIRPFIISSVSVTSYEGGEGQALTAGNYAIELTYVGAKTSAGSESVQNTTTVSSEGGSQ